VVEQDPGALGGHRGRFRNGREQNHKVLLQRGGGGACKGGSYPIRRSGVERLELMPPVALRRERRENQPRPELLEQPLSGGISSQARVSPQRIRGQSQRASSILPVSEGPCRLDTPPESLARCL
jgi:hypothetical protein